jgi:predicted RNase H-like nuclease (RuvC/YqgF family)
MKMHIEFIESAYENYERLKKDNQILEEKIVELSDKVTASELELENVRNESKNLKEVIKMNEVYFRQKEISLKNKISELQKRTHYLDDRLNYSQDKNRTIMSGKDDPFEKVDL